MRQLFRAIFGLRTDDLKQYFVVSTSGLLVHFQAFYYTKNTHFGVSRNITEQTY